MPPTRPVPWSDALTRRVRSLLKTGPLHQLRASEGRRDAFLAHDDTAALSMRAMEVLVDALGVRAGATRDDLEEALLPLLDANDRAHEVAPSRDRHRDVVAAVVAMLLNDAGRRQDYAVPYLDFQGGEPVRRMLHFRFASERETHDGAVVLHAEADGINLFLRALDIDLEDAQAAAEAVIRAQLQRGRLDLALQTAREAQIRSLQYADKIRSLLRQTRRDLGRVDWRHEVPALIRASLGHIEERLQAERDIHDAAQESLDRVPGTPEARALAEICTRIDECFRRHMELQQPLLEAHDVFLREQARQRFAPVALTPLPMIETELLHPTLALRAGEALAVVEAFTSSIAPAQCPLLPDLSRLWDRLLQPPRATASGRCLDDELAALPDLPAPFDDATVNLVDERLRALPGAISLRAFLVEGDTPAVQHLSVLRALQYLAPDGDLDAPVSVEVTGEALDRCGFWGDDLLLTPGASEAERIDIGRGAL